MAGLAATPSRIPASQQFAAISYLRWRLFVNAFRRKGGVGEIIARIIIYPVALVFVVGPAVGAGVGSYFAIKGHHLGALSAIFWGITLLQIFVSINISQPGLTFDPESLIRFPVTFTRYLIVRLFLGLLSASTIVGTCSLLAAALGTSIARRDLAGIVFTAVIALAITNMLFIRMIFAWIDRWLSTRRAREFFTGFIILMSVGFQYLNVTFNAAFNHGSSEAARRKYHAVMHFYHSSQSVLSHFPAGLAGASVVNAAGSALPFAFGNLVAILLFAALFLCVFAWRMQREYRGENLSDSGSLAAPAHSSAHAPAPFRRTETIALVAAASTAKPRVSPAFAAALTKEWIYIRRNTAQLYGILIPLAMVFIFASKAGTGFRASHWTFPAAIAYSTLGIAALSYNAFGMDAAGIQFYFLAPVSLRTVLLAKNLFTFAISTLEMLIVYVVLSYITVRPDAAATLETICWLVFAILANVTIGNMRSVIAPKKMDPGKLSRRQASQLSGLISMGVILVTAALGAGMIFLSQFLHMAWLPVPVFLALAIAAMAFYLAGLRSLDDLVATHRETMIEELCKAS